jgi:uncharacterized protein
MHDLRAHLHPTILSVGISVALVAVAVSLPALGGRPGPSAAVAAPTVLPTGSTTAGITVEGVGRVTLTPDLADLALGIQAQAATASAAQDQASGVMTRILAAVKRLGVADRDLATQWLSLQPRYAYTSGGTEPPRITGYQATQSLAVTVRDLSKVGAIIDAGVAAGANQVGGISFSLADPASASAQARAAAMADARARAQTLATAAGASLGQVLSISETDAPTPPPIQYSGALAAPSAGVATPVQPGTTEVEVDVTVSFALAG